MGESFGQLNDSAFQGEFFSMEQFYGYCIFRFEDSIIAQG
jgi:hypothetical protein